MPTIPVGYAQATMVYTGASLPYGAVTTLGLDVQGFTGNAQDAAEAVYLAWSQVVQGLAGAVRLTEVDVKFGPSSTGPSASAGGEAVATGGAVAPPNTAYLVSKTTALGGRQGKGRLFLPGVSEAAVDNAGVVDQATFTDLSGRLGDAFADLIAADLPPVLLHADGDAPTDILNFAISKKVATQRNRLRR